MNSFVLAVAAMKELDFFFANVESLKNIFPCLNTRF